MATSGPTLLPAFMSGDADFRTFAQGVHDALVACGMTQTSDTGQITIASATRPLANAFAGYEIWRFSDTLQATAPIFFKIEYGSGGAADRPSIAITVGTGSTGAGAITGQVTSRAVLLPLTSDSAGVTRALCAQGDSGQIHVIPHGAGSGATSLAFGFSIERTRDSTGAKTGDGFTVVYINAGAIATQHVPMSGAVPGTTSTFLTPGAGGASSIGTDTIMVPLLAQLGKFYYNLLHVMATTDMTWDTVFTADIFGVTHTFRSAKMTGATFIYPWE